MTTYFANPGHLLFFALVVLTTSLSIGSADARPNTRDFTCDGVRAYLDARGTAVMNTKNRSIFRKFYAPHQQCPFSTVHKAHRVPTKTGMCILYICREPMEPLFKRR